MVEDINWRDIHTIAFDFDGVFTDNKVLSNENGEEFIRCDRSDGLGIGILKSFASQRGWDLRLLVVSKERNKAAFARCRKLKLDYHGGVDNKRQFLLETLDDKSKPYSDAGRGLLYVGNDINDLSSFRLAQFSIAPKDSHYLVKNAATAVAPVNGGDKFVRYVVELVIGMERMTEEDILALIEG